MQSLRVAIAEDEDICREFLEEALTDLGHQVVAQARDGNELVGLCAQQTPDLVITDIKMPNMDGLTAVTEICRQRVVPVILVSAHHEAALVERAANAYVLAYLVKPFNATSLEPAIALAIQRHREFETVRREAMDLRQTIEDRKLIERAKGILMERTHLDEGKAHSRLQSTARRKRIKLVELARMILLVQEVFDTPGEESA